MWFKMLMDDGEGKVLLDDGGGVGRGINFICYKCNLFFFVFCGILFV